MNKEFNKYIYMIIWQKDLKYHLNVIFVKIKADEILINEFILSHYQYLRTLQQITINSMETSQNDQSVNNSTVLLFQTEILRVRNIDNNALLISSRSDTQLHYSISTKVPSGMRGFLKQRKIEIGYFDDEELSPKVSFMQKTSEIPLSENKIDNLSNEKKALQQPVEQNQQIDQNPLKIVKVAYAQQIIKQQASAMVDLTTKWCTICELNIASQGEQIKLFFCHHEFCLTCLKTYFQYKIKMFEQVYCPNQNCQELINTQSDFFLNQFTLNQRRQYQKIHHFYQTNTDRKNNIIQRLCPNQDCEGIITVNSESQVQYCQICKRSYCSKCFSSFHEGDCQVFQIEYMKQKLGLIQCQKCKNLIQKEEGCKHISCKCGYQFCELCKQSWQRGHMCKSNKPSKRQTSQGGCDWGMTLKDHLIYIVKLPLKLVLLMGISFFWTIFSFLMFPLNILVLLYWMWLLLIKPMFQKIQLQSECIRIVGYMICFPVTIFINMKEGLQLVQNHIDSNIPELSNSYRCIIRI